MSDPFFVLRRSRSAAAISGVGAALRELRVDDVDLVPRPASNSTPLGLAGAVLVPWPNRIRDGRYHFRGTSHQLAITAPGSGTASHGLLRSTTYRAREQTEDRVVLGADVVPQAGYPFHLRTKVDYTLRDDGVSVRHHVRNVGPEPAPFALGAHPYLCIGGVPTADLVLTSSGSSTLDVDDRGIPVGEAPAVGDTDLRGGRLLAEVAMDRTYRGFSRGAAGRASHTLTAPDGRSVGLWQDERFPWVHVFTTTGFPDHPLAVAVEPMTAPPNAFASGIDLRVLEPGESFAAEWGIVFHGSCSS